jgi:hypothetical protein
MCILKLSSLAFQGDNFLFYLLLVYVNNCKKNNSLQSHLLYFLILLGRIRKKYKRDSIEIFSNTCLKIANFWWQYNDYVHDLLTYTYTFLLKPIFYDIWFICNCILVTRYMMFIYLSSEQLSAIIGVCQGEQLAISRSRAHIAIVSFRHCFCQYHCPLASL